MAAQGYKISIGVTDNITKPIEAINKRLQAIHAPILRLQKSVSKFSDLSGLTAVSNGFAAVGRSAGRVLGAMSSLLPVMGAVTGVASVAGVLKLASAWAQFGNKLLNTSAILGVAPQRLQTLADAAEAAGASAADMESSIGGLNAAMHEALNGNSEVSALFKKYGVDIQSSAYQAKSGAEKMGDAFEIIKQLKKEGADAATIQKAMGMLGLSPGLTRMALQGRDGLKEYTKEAEHFGYQSEESAKQGAGMFHSIWQVTKAVEGLGGMIAEKVGPTITALLTQFAEWIVANRQMIASEITEYVRKFAEWIKSINWKEVIQGVKEFIAKIDNLVTSLGGWVGAGKAIFAMWAVTKLLGIASAVAKIGAALSNATVLRALGIWAGVPLAVIAGFFAEKDKGTKEAEVDEMARQLGYETEASDDMGHATSYRHPQTGRSGVSPDDIRQEYIDKGGFGSGVKNSAQMDAAAKEAWGFWKSKGMSDEAAAGLVAREQLESGFDPGARGDNGSAHGNFQWHEDRRLKILKGSGINVSTEHDANRQREALLWEMEHGDEQAHGKHLLGAKSYREGGSIMSREIIRPGADEAARAREAAATGDLAERRGKQFGHPSATGSIMAPPKVNPPPDGRLSVIIGNNSGFPVSADARGSFMAGAPRINQPMQGFA